MVDTGGVIWLTDVGSGSEGDVELGNAQVLRTEILFEETGDCEPGEQLGIVHIVETNAARNRVLVTATFDLDSGDTLVAHGVAERIQHQGRPSFRGRLGIGGGTGNFKGRRGQVEVDVCNPKRWIVDGP
jgi:hypothetical protein